MKKLLAVATIGVVGYLVVKKIKERKNNDVVEVNEEMENEEVVENVEEEIVVDNDEETIEVEDIEIVNEEKEEVKLVDKIKRCGKKLAGKVFRFLGQLLIKINKKLDKDLYVENPYIDDFTFIGEIKFHVFRLKRIVKGTILFINRIILILLVKNIK